MTNLVSSVWPTSWLWWLARPVVCMGPGVTKLWCSSWWESDTEHTHLPREWGSRLPTNSVALLDPSGPQLLPSWSSSLPLHVLPQVSLFSCGAPLGAKKWFKGNGSVCNEGERDDSEQFTLALANTLPFYPQRWGWGQGIITTWHHGAPGGHLLTVFSLCSITTVCEAFSAPVGTGLGLLLSGSGLAQTLAHSRCSINNSFFFRFCPELSLAILAPQSSPSGALGLYLPCLAFAHAHSTW